MTLRARFIVRDVLFTLMVCFTLFNYIPKSYSLFGLIAWPLTHHLFFYPFAIGFLFSLYCHWRWRDVFVFDRKFAFFIGLYLFVVLLSLYVGIWHYPYFHEIVQEPATHLRHGRFVQFIGMVAGHALSPETELAFVNAVSRTVQVFLSTFYTFGLAFIIYCWYRKAPREGLRAFSCGIFASLVIFIVVGIINVFSLLHYEWATDLLRHIYPYILDVKDAGDWWPPLLWPKQLRSVFPEPSYVGNYGAYVLPLLWTLCIRKSSWFSLSTKYVYLFTFLFTYLIFMTQARTPLGLFLGSLLLFIILVIWKTRMAYIKRIVGILLISSLGFGLSIITINQAQVFVPVRGAVEDHNTPAHNSTAESDGTKIATVSQKALGTYVDSNIKSLASNDDRSNGPRFELIKTGIRIFSEHPLLGVGTGLGTAYYIKYWDAHPPHITEIDMWRNIQKRDGLVSHDINPINQYVALLMDTGIVGTIVFLLPFAFLIYLGGKKLIVSKVDNNSDDLFIAVWGMTTIISSLVQALNGSYSMVYGNWFILGLIYTVWYEKNRT